jgi:hypothetical protein
MAFHSAEDRVHQDNFKDVLAVLAGRSRWREYITPNLEEALANIPGNAFQIVGSKQFTAVMERVDESDDLESTPGVTLKDEGVIYLQEWFGINSQATFLGAALHETVHLVSHHAGRGPKKHSTAWNYLGQGLLEGLVEVVTEDILQAQGITLARPKWRGHTDRVTVMRQLLEVESVPFFSVPFFAKILFGGHFQHLVEMIDAYTADGWAKIKQLTTANHPQAALRKIAEMRRSTGTPLPAFGV